MRALAAACRSELWRREAERRAGTVVSAAGADEGVARRFVDRILSG